MADKTAVGSGDLSGSLVISNSISVKLDVSVRLADSLTNKIKNCSQMCLNSRLMLIILRR